LQSSARDILIFEENKRITARKINKQTANAYLSKYYFSSYQDYIDATREISLILSKDIFPQYFVKKGSFKAYINDWINFDPLT